MNAARWAGLRSVLAIASGVIRPQDKQDYVQHRVINGHVSRSRNFAGRVVA